MGQLIEVRIIPMGEMAIFDTDRSITGQDGHDYDSLEEARTGRTFPAALAARVFEGLAGVDHVYVLSNQVVVRRSDGWDEAGLEEAADLVRMFFIHYEENKDAEVWREEEEEATP